MTIKNPPNKTIDELYTELQEALWIIKYQAKELIVVKRALKALERECSNDL